MPGRVVLPILVVCTAASLVVGSVVSELQAHSKPFAYTESPAPLVDPLHKYHPGDVVEIWISRCNYTSHSLSYIITRELQPSGDAEKISSTSLDSIPASISPGCERTLSSAHALPRDLVSGRYKFVFTALIKDDSKTIATLETQDFDVVR